MRRKHNFVKQGSCNCITHSATPRAVRNVKQSSRTLYAGELMSRTIPVSRPSPKVFKIAVAEPMQSVNDTFCWFAAERQVPVPNTDIFVQSSQTDNRKEAKKHAGIYTRQNKVTGNSKTRNASLQKSEKWQSAIDGTVSTVKATFQTGLIHTAGQKLQAIISTSSGHFEKCKWCAIVVKTLKKSVYHRFIVVL